MNVYGLGLPKTGTTTLKKALEVLKIDKIYVGDYVYFMNRDTFNGKYVFTWRNPDKWFRSVENWAKTHNSMNLQRQRMKMYGSKMPVKDLYMTKYIDHRAEMIKLFDPLIVNWENDDDWGVLCKYLNVDIPNIPFPHLNKQNYEKNSIKSKTS